MMSGGQVARRWSAADGTARPPARWLHRRYETKAGWEWTNSQGLRQGRYSSGRPQHRDGSAWCEGDARSAVSKVERGRGEQVSKPIDVGLEEICLRFAGGSISTTVASTTTVVREGVMRCGSGLLFVKLGFRGWQRDGGGCQRVLRVKLC